MTKNDFVVENQVRCSEVSHLLYISCKSKTQSTFLCLNSYDADWTYVLIMCTVFIHNRSFRTFSACIAKILKNQKYWLISCSMMQVNIWCNMHKLGPLQVNALLGLLSLITSVPEWIIFNLVYYRRIKVLFSFCLVWAELNKSHLGARLDAF